MKNFTTVLLLSILFTVAATACLFAQPINNNCANATLLTPATTCNPTAGTTENATSTTGSGDCDGDHRPDVWYRFVATSNMHQVSVDGAPSFDAKIGALTTCGGTTRPAGGECTDYSGDGGVEILNLSGLTIGQTYYIQVYDYYGANTAAADFNICVLTLPPSNDNCANAIPLTSSPNCMPLAGTTENATSSNAAGDCDGNHQPDVWYRFVATLASYQVRVDGGPDFDAKIGALTTCGGTLRPTGGECADYSGSDGIEILNLSNLTIGNTYYIQVYDFYGANTFSADFDICLIPLYPPNDNCANAASITPSPTCTATAGTTENATGGGQGSPCGTIQPDVWYSFVATSNMHQVRVDGVFGFDAVAAAWTDCGATAHPTGGNCVDATGDSGVEILNLSGLTVGNTYYIQVYDYYGKNDADGDFDICVLVSPPANDECANAILLTPSATCTSIAGTTENATGGGQGSACGTTQADVWYRFVATGATQRVRVDGGPAFDAVVAVWTDCGVTQQPTGGGCIDGTGTDGVENITMNGLTTGATYYIQVYDFYGNITSAADFDICVFGPPPANDRCSGAIAITNGSVISMSTLQATDDNAVEVPNCTNTTRVKGVWFVYTAAAGSTGTVTLSGCATSFDNQITVYRTANNNCPASNNAPTCVIPTDNSNDCNGGAENTTFTYSAPALQSGDPVAEFAPVNYYIYISGPGGNLNFTVTTVLPLELASFTGQIQEQSNILHWETLSEKEVAIHIVERSADGIRWTEIGSKNGLLHSITPTKYTLEDRSPLPKAYYRLRSVDADGKENYSHSIVLTRNQQQFGITSVFPSPAQDQVTLQFNTLQEETLWVELLDITGHLILKRPVDAIRGLNEHMLILTNLSSGIYMVRVGNLAQKSSPVRFVKG